MPAEVEHRQHVRVADLVLEREADDVELMERREGLEAVEREPVRPEGRLEVGQRREGALARPVRGVHQAVEHLEPVVAHPQRVGVGEGQADRPPDVPVVLADAVQLAPEVLRGGLDVGQDSREDHVLQVGIEHRRALRGVSRRTGRPEAGGAGPRRVGFSKGIRGSVFAASPQHLTRGTSRCLVAPSQRPTGPADPRSASEACPERCRRYSRDRLPPGDGREPGSSASPPSPGTQSPAVA